MGRTERGKILNVMKQQEIYIKKTLKNKKKINKHKTLPKTM